MHYWSDHSLGITGAILELNNSNWLLLDFEGLNKLVHHMRSGACRSRQLINVEPSILVDKDSENLGRLVSTPVQSKLNKIGAVPDSLSVGQSAFLSDSSLVF